MCISLCFFYIIYISLHLHSYIYIYLCVFYFYTSRSKYHAHWNIEKNLDVMIKPTMAPFQTIQPMVM